MHNHAGKNIWSEIKYEKSVIQADDFEKLRIATIRGQIGGIVAVLDKGISTNQVLKGGWSPLLYASSVGNPEIVGFLLKRGADPNFHKELFTPVMAACVSSKQNEDDLVECCNKLLEGGAVVDAVERHRLSPLMFAALNGRTKLVARLAASNANLDLQDNQGWTALFWAVNQGKMRVVEVLIKFGARLEIKDRKGQTALDLAIGKGLHEIGEMLRNRNGLITEKMPAVKKHCKRATFTELTNIVKNDKDRLIIEQLEKGLFGMPTENDVNYCQEELGKTDDVHLLETTKDFTIQFRTPYSVKDAITGLRSTLENIKRLYERVSYIRLRLQGHPLNIPTECAASINTFQDLTTKSLQQSQLLNQELAFLNRHTKQIDGSDNIISADVIASYPRYSYASKLSACAVLIIVSMLTLEHLKCISLPIKMYFFK